MLRHKNELNKMKNRNQKGFSLVELLVVVIIIAIVAAIAIPSLLASRRAANEASAIASLRTIHSAQGTYFGTLGSNANFATVANLAAAGMIDSSISGGSKSGYTFALTLPGTAPFTSYCATAIATTQGSTGTRRFGVGTPGTIWQDSSAALPCAAGVLDTSAGTASAVQ